MRTQRMLLLIVAGLWCIGIVLVGCSAPRGSEAERAGDDSGPAEVAGMEEDEELGRSGAELWAQRCSQCHWARDPGTFSKAQWKVIMFHMRVRANLTPREHESILEFITSASR